jgi:DNA repair protein RadC
MVQKGQAVLSDAELIAILIGSGNRDESAVELSKRILAAARNNLHELGKLSIAQLQQFKGIGEAKAVCIAAALEMGRRRRLQGPLQLSGINSSQDAFNVLQPLRIRLQERAHAH